MSGEEEIIITAQEMQRSRIAGLVASKLASFLVHVQYPETYPDVEMIEYDFASCITPKTNTVEAIARKLALLALVVVQSENCTHFICDASHVKIISDDRNSRVEMILELGKVVTK